MCYPGVAYFLYPAFLKIALSLYRQREHSFGCLLYTSNQAGYYGVERKEAYIRSEEYLKQLDLWGKRNERARMLSGGMKRRLMIARALMHEPKLLILDEPTAGVDIELRRSMWGFLKDLNDKGTTIILTTQDVYKRQTHVRCLRYRARRLTKYLSVLA